MPAVGTPPVVVVGDVVVDIVVRHDRPLAPSSDTVATVRTTGGGAAANTAVWLSRLGLDVTLVARVGDDPAGRAQAAELAGHGVRCRLAVDPAAPTGSVVVLVGPDGERTMLSDRGANLRLTAADLPPMPSGGHLHLSGYTLLDGGCRPAGLAALRLARAAGLTVSVDPASSAPLAAAGPAAFLGWTRGADLLLPNLPEAQLLAGLPDDAPAATAGRALAGEYGAVAVTEGADGALWCRAGHVVHRPAPPATVVDSTGAGDAFSAGLLAAWLTGAAGPDAIDRGMRLAAGVLGRLGARPGPAGG